MENKSLPFLKRVIIKDLFGFKQVDWPLNRNVSVLVGENGTGKSTILRIIDSVLNSKNKNLDIKKIAYAKLVLSEGGIYESLKNGIDENLLAKMKDLISKLSLESKLEASLSPEYLKAANQTLEFIENANIQMMNSVSIPNRTPLIKITPSDNITEAFNVVYISTFDMMIMSKQEYDSVSEDVYTQLDFEIKKEIAILTKKLLSLSHKSVTEVADNKAFSRQHVKDVFSANFETINKFSRCVNNFLSDNNKTFKINEDGSFSISHFDRAIDITSLSSGEKQLLLILIKVINSADRRSIFILDEPEISLHLKWQEKLISEIIKLNEDCQVIIATHSPAVVMQGWMDCLVDINDITTISK